MSENESSFIMTIHTRMGEESGRREEKKRERNIGKEDVGKERERERERERDHPVFLTHYSDQQEYRTRVC